MYNYSTDEGKSHWYLDRDGSVILVGLINLGSYFILLNTMLPISLIVTMEITKVIQALHISWDTDMFSLAAGKGMTVNTTTINEELG